MLVSVAFGLAAEAWAEGAVKLLECDVVRICDALGACQASSGEVSFRMEPQEIQASGAGDYTISFAGTQAPMRAASEAGPFLWTNGSERHALLASSETEWLWHELEIAAAPVATVRFLVCTLQQ